MTTPVKRVLIADDHDLMREGVRALLETRPDIKVVAEAGTGCEALSAAHETRPDIAIIDYLIPELNGRELTVELKRHCPDVEILIYTQHDREDLIMEVLEAGARGFVLKSEAKQHLFAAIDALSIHRPYFSGVVSEALLEQCLRNKGKATLSTLTHREREVVQLIAEGKINKQVAQLLNVSIKTVEAHRATAMQKLKLRTTAELVHYAIKNSLIQL